MSLAEIRNGRGAPMPLHELTVEWPAYFAYEARRKAAELAEQERAQRRIA